MSNPIAPFVIIPAIFIAGGLAVYGVDRMPDAAPGGNSASTRPLAPIDEMAPAETAETLPLNHPPIGAAASPHGSMPTRAADAPAIVWKMPASWEEAPNPNSMRLATYRAPGGVEVSVSRAGGDTEANLQRWIAQFDDVGRELGRVEKTVRGLHVVTVDIRGIYVGGGANMGGPAEPKANWRMVGSIIESRSPPYFFKMTGPTAAVRAARPAFDHLLDEISPA